jgi:hypothetical protein
MPERQRRSARGKAKATVRAALWLGLAEFLDHLTQPLFHRGKLDRGGARRAGDVLHIDQDEVAVCAFLLDPRSALDLGSSHLQPSLFWRSRLSEPECTRGVTITRV